MGNTIIASLQTSEDIGTMSGDILKAFGENAMFKLESIAEDFSVTPIYSQEVLSQINSAKIYRADSTDVNVPLTRLNISQTSDGIIFQGYIDNVKSLSRSKYTNRRAYKASALPKFADAKILYPQFEILRREESIVQVTSAPNASYSTINMYKDLPTPDDNMVATRLMSTGE